MHKSKKALSLLLTLALVFTVVSPAFAFSYIVPPEDEEGGSDYADFYEGQLLAGKYLVEVKPAEVATNTAYNFEFRIKDVTKDKYLTGNDLKNFYEGFSFVVRDPKTVVFSVYNNNRFNESQVELTYVDKTGVYYDEVIVGPDPNQVGMGARLDLNDKRDALIIRYLGTGQTGGNYNPFEGLSASQLSLYVKDYGRMVVQYVDPKDGKVYTAPVFYATPISYEFVSGNKEALESYAETVKVYSRYANFEGDAYLSIYEKDKDKNNEKLWSYVKLSASDLKAIGPNNEYGYVVVLPPMSSKKEYRMELQGTIEDYAKNVRHYGRGSAKVPVKKGSTTLVEPKDNVLAYDVSDVVTFTIDDSIPNADDSNLKVPFEKYVAFTIKYDGKKYGYANNFTEAASAKRLFDPLDYATTKIPSTSSSYSTFWYKVTKDGLVPVMYEGLNNKGVPVYDFGSKITNAVKEIEVEVDGKKVKKQAVTIGINLPSLYDEVKDAPRVESFNIHVAYTNPVAIYGSESNTLKKRDYYVEGPSIKGGAGKLEFDHTTMNANEFYPATAKVTDVHGRPVADAKIGFSQAVAAVGGTGGLGFTNVVSSVETDKTGTVEVNFYFSTTGTVKAQAGLLTDPRKVDLTVKSSQQTGTKVQFVIDSDKYWLNGKEFTMEAFQGTSPAPYIAPGDRTVVPASYIARGLNAQVFWDANTKTATFVRGDTTVQMKVGSKIVKITKGGSTFTQTMEAAATTMDANGMDAGRIFVPAKYVANAFGYEAKWDAETKTVTIE
ncbi:MAG: copper amine oxidase N-terminal domain-containing protein [Candidatus Carbobacillus sp.]|nr:copper amine oxidase N-terminal domain-containing protein [Candidatus Carbobacillus sp.]